MGISQLPTTPVPTAKGDLIVGTATGPTRLPISTVANQTLLVDSTTTTGLKYGSQARAWNQINLLFANPTSGAGNIGGNNPPSKIIFANNTYAFVNANYIFYSTDKINWNVQTVSTSSLQTLAANASGSVWVAAGGSNQLFSGTPGGTWTARTSQISGTSTLGHVIWQPNYNLFVLTGTTNASPWNMISTSPDGATWTARWTANNGASNTGRQVVHNNSTTTLVPMSVNSANAAYSTNGTTWADVNINDGAANTTLTVWLPTAGRFQVMGSNAYSQTPASIGTAWSTSPITRYSTFVNTVTGTTSFALFPEYDSVRGVWYMFGLPYPSPSTQGVSAMFTISDTTAVRTFFDANTNQYHNKVNSVELLPIATLANQGFSGVMLTYVNNTLFLVCQIGSQLLLFYSDVV